jgi:hypothetical protein
MGVDSSSVVLFSLLTSLLSPLTIVNFLIVFKALSYRLGSPTIHLVRSLHELE